MNNTTTNSNENEVNKYTFIMCFLGCLQTQNIKSFDKAGFAYYVSTIFSESEKTRKMFPYVLPDRDFKKMFDRDTKIDEDTKREGAVLCILSKFEDEKFLKNVNGKLKIMFDDDMAWEFIESVTEQIDGLRLDLEIRKISQNFVMNESLFIKEVKEIKIKQRLCYCLNKCNKNRTLINKV